MFVIHTVSFPIPVKHNFFILYAHSPQIKQLPKGFTKIALECTDCNLISA